MTTLKAELNQGLATLSVIFDDNGAFFEINQGGECLSGQLETSKALEFFAGGQAMMRSHVDTLSGIFGKVSG